ncbi:hypothetical protein RvY_03161-1 [Ramazzottius varieornatus]|uniref:Cilia- and flagella-associated protein 251 n=1 Tax=Ramazzottius varieornatus TaxID=947166 RepID=A0A1D1UWK6_RAMVA|nr:hypothetical protein RvY_03161-1 [Ramazzottius varieornatus]
MVLGRKLRQKQAGNENSPVQSPTPGCDVRKNFGVQCEQADEVSTAYAEMHRDPYLILLKSMETFPPTSAPINPVDEEKIKTVFAEKKAGVNDAKEKAILKEFKTSQPTLLPLKLEWTFGINRHVPFINLTSARHSSIFYSAGQTAVLYSYDETDSKQEAAQILLEGLSRQITCIATTKNGRWMAAGDTGSDYSAIVWDQKDALPLRMYSQPNGKEAYGLTSICFSPDMRFLAMLSSGPRQVLTIFEWLVDKKGKNDGQDVPLVYYQLSQQEDMHSQLSFSPLDQSILMSCSQSGVVLYKWNMTQSAGQVRICIPNIQKVPNSMVLGKLTRAVFVDVSTYFVIGTMNGTIALFQKRTSHKKVLAFEKYAEIVKVYKVVDKGSVTALTSLNGMIVVGDSLGNVNFYDCNFLLLYTCSNIGFGSINNISFSRIRAHKELAINFANKALFLSEFLIGTSSGHIVKVRTTGDDVYETKLVREEPPDAVIACAVHPNAYRLLIGSSDGLLRMWDYKHKSILVQRRFPLDSKEDLLSKDITSLAFDPTGIYPADSPPAHCVC